MIGNDLLYIVITRHARYRKSETRNSLSIKVIVEICDMIKENYRW